MLPSDTYPGCSAKGYRAGDHCIRTLLTGMDRIIRLGDGGFTMRPHTLFKLGEWYTKLEFANRMAFVKKCGENLPKIGKRPRKTGVALRNLPYEDEADT